MIQLIAIDLDGTLLHEDKSYLKAILKPFTRPMKPAMILLSVLGVP